MVSIHIDLIFENIRNLVKEKLLLLYIWRDKDRKFSRDNNVI